MQASSAPLAGFLAILADISIAVRISVARTARSSTEISVRVIGVVGGGARTVEVERVVCSVRRSQTVVRYGLVKTAAEL